MAQLLMNGISQTSAPYHTRSECEMRSAELLETANTDSRVLVSFIPQSEFRIPHFL